MRTSRLAVVALLVAATLPAQVFIVDAAGGAGSHFTDLPQAVAAVPSGSTLRVRAGTYTGFTIQGKGLAIVGEGAVVIQVGFAIKATTLTDRVLLRGLSLYTTSAVIADAAGPVSLEYCELSGPQFDITRSTQVRLHACRYTGSYWWPSQVKLEAADLEVSRCSLFGRWELAAIRAFRSRCTIVDSVVVGGKGFDEVCWHGQVWSPSTPGAPACQLETSTLIVSGGSMTGGDGGQSSSLCSGSLGAGGVGLHAVRDAAIVLLGSLPTGGYGGPVGQPYVLGPNSRIHHSPNVLSPVAWLTGNQARGQTVHIELRAAPSSLAVIAFSYTGLTAPLEPYGVGSFLLHPALVSAPVVVPATGALTIPLPLPASLPLSEIYTGQALTWQPPGLLASNTFTLLATQ